MRVAAIELGSNAFHMLIADTLGPASFAPVLRDKMMIQLGKTALITGTLDPSDMSRGLRCLAELRRIALSRGVERTIAAATSTIRETGNGEEFLRRARQSTGFPIRAISGREEARLIHLAVSRAVDLGKDRALLADIGGGSVELSVGDGERVHFATSLRLGFLRLQGRFVTRDPMGKVEARTLTSFLRESLKAAVAAARKRGPDRAIATGGSMTSLLRLAQQLRGSSLQQRARPGSVGRREIRKIARQLLALPAVERARQFDLDPVRAEYLPTALLTLDTILEGAGIGNVEICSVALCEGLIHDYLNGRPAATVPSAAGDPRMQAVLDLAARCEYPAEHSHRVALLAGQVFRQTAALHGLGEYEGRLLEYAAILHDIGYHISYARHHKHAFYLVMNCDLRGFAPAERRMLANLARYHRRAAPRASHAAFGDLAAEDRQVVAQLSALLRIADAMDMTHFSAVDEVQTRAVGKRLYFLLIANDAYRRAPLDLAVVKRHARRFEKIFGVETFFRVRRPRVCQRAHGPGET